MATPARTPRDKKTAARSSHDFGEAATLPATARCEKKRLHIRRTHLRRMCLVMEQNVAFNPIQINPLRADAIVLHAQTRLALDRVILAGFRGWDIAGR